MEAEPWIFALKAGKLGFTELECAFDGWVARFGHPNARVHLLSKDTKASRDLLGYVKFGLSHLPPELRLPILDAAGGNTTQSLMLLGPGDDDVRTIVSYATGSGVAIDQSASHTHVDELSHADGEPIWNSVATTVPEGGTIHIVTRGAGDQVYTARLWAEAGAGTSRLKQFFAAWDERPGRDEAFRRSMEGTLTTLGLSYFLPATAADALMGDEESPYIPLEIWDQLYDPTIPLLEPGSKEAIVLALDAAVTNDCFGVAAVTRHPDPKRHEEVVIRRTRKWSPTDFASGRIDFDECERWIRLICGGGCANGHPCSWPDAGCDECAAKRWAIPPHNVVQVTFDPFQLEDMSQRLVRDGVAWMSEFDQGTERLIGDGMMYRLALQRKLWHSNDPDLREHIGNSKAKLQTDQESHMRIVKKAPARKIDLAVAAAMAVKRCLALNI